ncbi:hypothetical protein C6356_15465 [Bacillus wiedmannii]|nr:hypothetical protein C6356_15465 [Bacillus wiedmannii]
MLGFIIPWFLGLWLYKREPKIIILIAPIGIAVAFLINDWGSNYFWQFKPVFRNVALSALPLNIGLYPITVCFFIYLIVKKIFHTFILFFIFTLFLTGLEGILLHLGRVKYFNGWNIFWTCISYFVAIFIIYVYSRILMSYQILKDTN